MNESDETKNESEIIVNDYGETVDSAVVVDEKDRTVLLTEKETIIIPKEEPGFDMIPKNRPRKVYGGMWGQTEIATVGIAMLVILTVIVLYIFLVLPAQKELADNQAKQDQLRLELNSATEKYGSITSTEAHVAKLLQSVDDFEGRILRFDSIGKPALYGKLNSLIGAYGLTPTTGPDYAPLEINAQQVEEDQGKAKFQSIFPGVYVTTTLEGSYQNLRRFIREIETSDQFIVISAVELEPAENKEDQDSTQTSVASIPQPNQSGKMNRGGTVTSFPTPQAVKPRGKTSGEIVALRLEMAAYFRRANYQPIPVDAER
jgi:Tfp pilus assembly protein PilO